MRRDAGEGSSKEGGQGRAGKLSPRHRQGRAGQGRRGPRGGPAGQGRAGQKGTTFEGVYWSTCSGTGLYRGCYSPHGCGEAGERLGSLCAIEVEGLKL